MLKLCYSNFERECGSDEAGRGCLAGPVVAAAVVNPEFENTSNLIDSYFKLMADSKTISEKKRHFLKPLIESTALDFAVSFVDNAKIDEINILNASILAMQTAILKPSCKSRKLSNLYYTGQLTVPGPGVPPALISGEVVAKMVIKEFNLDKR